MKGLRFLPYPHSYKLAYHFFWLLAKDMRLLDERPIITHCTASRVNVIFYLVPLTSGPTGVMHTSPRERHVYLLCGTLS